MINSISCFLGERGITIKICHWDPNALMYYCTCSVCFDISFLGKLIEEKKWLQGLSEKIIYNAF